MPLVEFCCPDCFAKVEQLVRATCEAATPSCPVCSVTMERSLAAFSTGGTTSDTGCAPSSGFS